MIADGEGVPGGVVAGPFREGEDVDHQEPPDWPGHQLPKQMHLDLFVTDLDTAERAAIGCGAIKADFQPAPDRRRVLLDPAGHPYCLTLPPRASV
ncbi:VOC family protein [Nocardia sp. NPDC057663]|uniref:VOC family protein n=1 Tax=Nocardia sp. NPDC057663 TaxID=3346201 RepID=UPI00366C9DEE